MRRIRRRDLLRVCGSAGVIGIAGCLSGSGETGFREGFEDGIGDWEGDAAIGPGVDIEDFAWEIGVEDTVARDGDHSLRIWNEGDYDDGTTWAVHPVSVEPGQAYQMSVTAQFWSESESFNLICDSVMRLGRGRPTAEEDFPQQGQNTTELAETPYGGLSDPL